MTTEWGPLAALAGTWEGDSGIDTAYSNSLGEVIETPYRERAEFKPFGPVENGRQVLYGLDYRSAMWRGSEDDPFHTEVGYWLWDAATTEVTRCFVVPRGVTVLAGGRAEADATAFTLRATAGDETYGISSNQYLTDAAPSLRYEANIALDADGVFSYAESTILRLRALGRELDHSDRNTLRRITA